jgi:hypothetical protein
LTFAHDYYAGDSRFFRYAKTKYMKITSGGVQGLHMIQTKITTKAGKRKTTYRHTFIFPEDVNGRRIEATVSEPSSAEQWNKSLVTFVNGIGNVVTDNWYPIPSGVVTNPVSFRKTDKEIDYVVFRTIKPGMEFNLVSKSDSLCFFLDNGVLSVPITYINPESITSLDIGFTINNAMMIKATKCYVELRKITDNFNKARIASWPDLEDAFNFILVGSSVDTPDFTINKVLHKFVKETLDAVTLDVVRTFLINNSKIGLGYSSTRFSQHLLNLGARRNHYHNFLCKTIQGTRADDDSEDWDNESADEDLIVVGQSNPIELTQIEEDCANEVPSYMVKPAAGALDVDDTEDMYGVGSRESSIKDWAEEVIANLAETVPADPLEVSTVPEFYPWSDSDEEGDSEGEVAAAVDGLRAMSASVSALPEIHQTTANVTTSASNSPVLLQGEHADVTKLFNEMFQGVSAEVNFDDEWDSSSAAGDTADATNNIMSIDELFAKALGGSYDRIIDHKDRGLKSERTGHTVSPSLESSRAFIDFISRWLKTAGSATDFDDNSSLPRDISGLTGLYLTMHSTGMLEFANPLERFYGQDEMVLPVSLSALAIVSSIYNV